MKRFIPILIGFLFLSCNQSPNLGITHSDNKMSGETEFDKDDFSGMEETTTGFLGNEGEKLSGNGGKQLLAQNQPSETKDQPATKKKDSRKMIKTASMRMEVSDFKENRIGIEDAIAKYDATITSENEERSSYRLQNTIVIRVKPEQFDQLLSDLEELALNLDNKNIDAKDVTEQFVDITARLRTKRDVEARYRDILKQARTIPDILAVEGQLRTVVEEIESLEGRLKYLNDQVGYSTINFTYYEAIEQTYSRKKSFFKRIGNAFGDGWDGLKEFLIGLTSIWPFILIFGGLGWWGIRRWRARKRKKA